MGRDLTYGMTAAEEAVFDKKVEQDLGGHRGLINGRDFRWNTFRYQKPPEAVSEEFNKTFPHAPDSPEWWNKRYCEGCDKLYSMCECADG
jgi:hypothetical protein